MTLRNDVGFATVYPMIYCRKFMTLSYQTLCCICKCIRISVIGSVVFDSLFSVSPIAMSGSVFGSCFVMQSL